MLDRGNSLVTKQIEVAEMIYELDKRQLLRLWSVLSSFGEIRETKDPTIQSEILRRAQLVLTDFVFGLKRVPQDQTSTAALEGESQPNGDVRRVAERAHRTVGRFRCPLNSYPSLSGPHPRSGFTMGSVP